MTAGICGAVGHVERFDPALLELRRRVREGLLGDVFMISTEPVGPFQTGSATFGVVPLNDAARAFLLPPR